MTEPHVVALTRTLQRLEQETVSELLEHYLRPDQLFALHNAALEEAWEESANPTAKKVLVTVPASFCGTDDLQVLVWQWSTGQLDADVRSPADCSVTWTPVALRGGTVERCA